MPDDAATMAPEQTVRRYWSFCVRSVRLKYEVSTPCCGLRKEANLRVNSLDERRSGRYYSSGVPARNNQHVQSFVRSKHILHSSRDNESLAEIAQRRISDCGDRVLCLADYVKIRGLGQIVLGHQSI